MSDIQNLYNPFTKTATISIKLSSDRLLQLTTTKRNKSVVSQLNLGQIQVIGGIEYVSFTNSLAHKISTSEQRATDKAIQSQHDSAWRTLKADLREQLLAIYPQLPENELASASHLAKLIP